MVQPREAPPASPRWAHRLPRVLSHSTSLLLVVGGAVAALAAMVAEGRLGPRDPNVTDPSFWWGILPSAPPGETTRGVLAGVSALSVITLGLCWAVLVRAVLAGRVGTRTGLAAAAAWSLPFAVGPPLFSRDAYAYAGQGELARLGLDPATHGIATLLTAGAADGSGPAFVHAVDPRWSLTHSPYGGAAVAVERAAAIIGGGPTGTVVVLRIVAVLATLALIALALRLAGPAPGPRAAVAVLVAANPVVVIHLVGGAHLDALVAAAVVAALVVDRAGDPPGSNPLTGAAATALAALAFNVKATALLAVGWLMVAHLLAARREPRPLHAGATRLAGDLVAVAATTGLCTAAAGFGPTWIHSLSTSGTLSTGIAPASLCATLVNGLLGLVGAHPGHGPTLRVTRALCLLAAAAVVAALVLRAWRRGGGPVAQETSALDTRPDLAVLGLGGLAVALGNPVVYPWYLASCLPALALLAALLAGRARAVTAAGTAVVSAWLCLATLPPLAATWRLLGRAGATGLVTLLGLAAVAGSAALVAARRRPAPPTSTP